MRHANESFVRWQATTLAQLGYAINLILSLATASLGFALTLAKDRDYASGCAARCLWLLSVLFLLASVAAGMWCVVNRLHDFRETKDIARDRELWEGEKIEGAEIDKLLHRRREKLKRLGEATWATFRWQVGTFGAGIILQIFAFAATYHSKLFPG